MLAFGSTLALILFTFILNALCDNPYYVIVPNLENNPDTNNAIDVEINQKVNDPSKVFRSKSDNEEIDTLYWWAPLSDSMKSDLLSDQGEKIRKIEDISILPGGTDDRVLPRDSKGDHPLTKRDITSQKSNVPWHLKMVCQKPGMKLSDVDDYYYDDSAGSGIQVYIIDSGLRRSHQEFNDVSVAWMHAGPFATQDENDAESHGTEMASAALGVRDGTAKRPSLTVVRADIYSTGQRKLAPLIWLDAVKQVYDDIKANHKGKAVVNMSWGFSDSIPRDSQAVKDLNDALKDGFTKVLKPLIADLDAPAFVASGNGAALNPTVDYIPAVLGGSTLPDLVVVGGVDENGYPASFAQTADYVVVNAPAEDIEVAGSAFDDTYLVTDGTSHATAMTSGLTAYFMGLGNSAADARKKLLSLADKRTDRGPKVIWNGIDTTTLSAPPASSGSGAVPPPQNVDSGVLQCKAQHNDGDTKYYFNREGGLNAIGTFCKDSRSNGLIIGGSSGTALQEQALSDGQASSLDISMEYKDGQNCIPLDFTQPGAVDTCKERFGNVVDGCDLVKRTSDAWKQGGTFTRDCVTYKLVVSGQ